MLTDMTKPPKTKGSTNIIYKKTWMDLDIYDHDGVASVKVQEVDPVTKEYVRDVELLNPQLGSTMDPNKRKSFSINYNSAGVGNASLLRVTVTDVDGNIYESYINLVRKQNSPSLPEAN